MRMMSYPSSEEMNFILFIQVWHRISESRARSVTFSWRNRNSAQLPINLSTGHINHFECTALEPFRPNDICKPNNLAPIARKTLISCWHKTLVYTSPNNPSKIQSFDTSNWRGAKQWGRAGISSSLIWPEFNVVAESEPVHFYEPISRTFQQSVRIQSMSISDPLFNYHYSFHYTSWPNIAFSGGLRWEALFKVSSAAKVALFSFCDCAVFCCYGLCVCIHFADP